MKQIFILALLALLFVTSPAFAVQDGTHLMVRIGDMRLYYYDCTVATNILEPGDADVSRLVVRTCADSETVTAPAPSWVQDAQATYGLIWMPGGQFGECSLIQHQFIAGASQAITLECANVIHQDGFEALTGAR